MVHAHQVQHRGVQVVHADRVFGHVVREVVGRAVADSSPDASARKPDREAPRVVVPAVHLCGELALAVHGPAEFAAPDHQRLVEQAALLEILHQGRGSLVRLEALLLQAPRQRVVVVPAAVEQLHAAHSALDQPAGQQAVAGICARLARVLPVHLHHALRLARKVRQFRHRGLHAVGHFVLCDAVLDLRIAELLEANSVQRAQVVQIGAPVLAGESVRVVEVQDRLPAGAELHGLVARGQEAAAPQARIQGLAAAALRDHHHVRRKAAGLAP